MVRAPIRALFLVLNALGGQYLRRQGGRRWHLGGSSAFCACSRASPTRRYGPTQPGSGPSEWRSSCPRLVSGRKWSRKVAVPDWLGQLGLSQAVEFMVFLGVCEL